MRGGAAKGRPNEFRALTSLLPWAAQKREEDESKQTYVMLESIKITILLRKGTLLIEHSDYF